MIDDKTQLAIRCLVYCHIAAPAAGNRTALVSKLRASEAQHVLIFLWNGFTLWQWYSLRPTQASLTRMEGSTGFKA
jgi:hypothetical protein